MSKKTKNPVTKKMVGLAFEKVISAQRKYNEIILKCTHEKFRPLTKGELTDRWMSIGAYCQICGKDFGWRCKESPDSVCHYESDEMDTDGDGNSVYGVELITEEYVDIPEGHNPDHENEDSCIFCGLPEERK